MRLNGRLDIHRSITAKTVPDRLIRHAGQKNCVASPKTPWIRSASPRRWWRKSPQPVGRFAPQAGAIRSTTTPHESGPGRGGTPGFEVAGGSPRGRGPTASSSSRRPEFLDRLADLVPPPRKHRHRYHGVFAPNHKLRRAVTALAVGNIGKRREAAAGRHGGGGHATEGCGTQAKPRSHDTSRIAWAKLMTRVGEEFPLECPACGGDIRLIAFKLLFECETIPGLRTLGNLRLLQTSCPRARADPEDFDAPRRTARTSASVTCPWPAHRLGRPRGGPR